MSDISKTVWRGGNQLAPVPVVLIGCGDGKLRPFNVFTVAWCGTVCSEPPMLSISVRPERFSYKLISETGDFSVNIPSVNLASVVDSCGVLSGRLVDKISKFGLTVKNATKIKAPVIAECPINLECRVNQCIKLGSHDLFIADILAVQVSSKFVNQDNSFDVSKSNLLAYAHGQYCKLGDIVGKFGFSVSKKI